MPDKVEQVGVFDENTLRPVVRQPLVQPLLLEVEIRVKVHRLRAEGGHAFDVHLDRDGRRLA